MGKFFISFIFSVICFIFSTNFTQKSVYAASAPYGGTPWVIPGTIEFKDYDTGGEGVGFHDTDAQNIPGEYRPNEAVDIEITPDVTGGRHQVGYIHSGEWLQYTVNILYTGTYKMQISASSGNSSQTFHMSVDGASVTGPIHAERGLWNDYADIYVENIPLTKGTHTLRIHFDNYESNGWWGFNWMHFDLTSAAVPEIPVIVPTPGATIFYVAPNGNDTNPGSLSAPWKTIAKAANTATAGQTVYIRTGTYLERLIPKNSGTQDAYIIFSAYPGEVVTLDGTGPMPQLEGVVTILKKSFIRITGMRIINAGVGETDGKWNSGIHMRGSDHIVIDHNYVANTWSWAIHSNMFSSYLLVDNNELTGMNFGSNDDETGLGLKSFSHHLEVSNNYVHHGRNEGIGTGSSHDVKTHHNRVEYMGHPALANGNCRVGIYIDSFGGHAYNVDIYNNTVHHVCGEGISVASEADGLTENVNVFNNLIYANDGVAGIGVVNWSSITTERNIERNIAVINNTVYNNTNGGIYVNNDDVDNVIIRNNIVYGNSGFGQIKVESNVPAGEVLLDHNLTSNPNFVNAASGNFHLQSNSAAINSGSSTGAPTFDFDNKMRPIGNSFDIGAFEYGTSETTKPGDANNDFQVNVSDLIIWIANYGKNVSGASNANFNNDTIIDGSDYAIWFANYGK